MPKLKVAEPAGIVGFYLWGNIPEPWTLYKGIKCLPKGSFIKVKDGEIIEQKEWHKLRDSWLFEEERNSNLQDTINKSVILVMNCNILDVYYEKIVGWCLVYPSRHLLPFCFNFNLYF